MGCIFFAQKQREIMEAYHHACIRNSFPGQFVLPFLLLVLRLLSNASVPPSQCPPLPFSNPFITSSCENTVTEFKCLCIISLTPFAPQIQNNLTKLANASLTVAMEAVYAVEAVALDGGGALDTHVVSIIKGCGEHLSDAADWLNKAIGALDLVGGEDGGDREKDINEWVSSAMTDEETCKDELDELRVKDSDLLHVNYFKGNVSLASELTTIALDVISTYLK